MTGDRVIDTLGALVYLGVLLLFAVRPAWFDRLTSAAIRRAKEMRGMVSW